MLLLRDEAFKDISISDEVLFILVKADVDTWNMPDLVFSEDTKSQLLLEWLHLASSVARFL